VLALESFHGQALPPEARWLPALRAARLPGRMQRLASRDLVPALLDAAHNPAGAEALAAQLAQADRRLGTSARRRVFFSAMRDKDVPAVARALAAVSPDLVFVDLSARHARALPGGEARALLPASEFPGLRVAEASAEALKP